MIRRTHHFLHWLLGLFVVYLLITRVFISWVQFYPQQFIDVIQTLTGAQFQAASIDIDQDWLGFQIHLHDVLLQTENFVFQAEELEADINTFAILIPKIGFGDYLKVSQGAFQEKHVRKTAIDKEGLSNIKLEELVRVDANVSRLWKRVQFHEFVFSEVTRPGLSIQFHDFQSINASRLSVVSEFSLSYRDVLKYERFNLTSSFAVDILGGLDSGEFALSSFSPLEITDLATLLSKNWQSVLPDGELLLDLKGKVAHAELFDLTLNLNGQALSWRQKAKSLPSSVGLQLNWNSEQQKIKRRFKDWLFTLSKIQIDNRYIKSVSPMKLYFDGDKYLHFDAEYFELEPFKVLVKALIKTPHVSDFFDKTAYLSISDLSGKLHWETLDVPELKIDFKKLDVPVTRYPGVSIRNMLMHKTPDGITLSTTKPIWVMSPSIHSIPMRVDLPSKFSAGYDQEAKLWNVPHTEVEVDGMLMSAEVSALSSKYIDTGFTFKFGDMDRLKQYLPHGFMSGELKKWLDASLLSGEDIVVQGKVKGLLDDFPFIDKHGVFDLQAQVKNAALKFDADWPVLQSFDAELRFKPYQLDISVDKVDVDNNLNAKNVLVTIFDLDKDDIALVIKGEVETSLDKAMGYLQSTPLAEIIGLQSFLQSGVKFSGKSKVKLDKIWVPITGHKDSVEEVSGHVVFQDANVHLLGGGKLTKLNGVLDFTDSAVSANDLAFEFLGGSAKADVITDVKMQNVLVNAKGNFFEKKRAWFVNPVPWQSSLELPLAKSKTNLVKVMTNVDLQKGGSKLPSPLDGKSLVGKKLQIKTTLDKGLISSITTINGLLQSELEWQASGGKNKITKLQVLLGGVKKNSSSDGFSYVKGVIDEVDIDGWLSVLGSVEMSGGGVLGVNQLNWSDSDVVVGSARYLARDYPNIGFKWRSNKDEPLVLAIKASDVAGTLVFSEQKESIEIDLTKLNIFTNQAQEFTASKSSQVSCLEPLSNKSTLPRVDFKARNISVDERKIDEIKFTMVDDDEMLRIESISGKFGKGSGVISGNYVFDKQARSSALKAELESTEVAVITDMLNMNRGFTGQSAGVNLNLSWSGGAECFSTKTAAGGVGFVFRDGSIEDVEPGVARLIGLLSVESLVRRLRLDLKDVTNKGMFYDEIKGTARLSEGVVKLEGLTLKAPSVSGKIKGDINVIKEIFNLKAEITPKIGATVPTIAALAGSTNPLAALAVYTLMKVLPGVNENIITYKYGVTGSWDSPIIEELGAPPKTDSIKDEGGFEEGVLEFQ